MALWERSNNVEYPQTYRTFNGKVKDGSCKSYWIQDLTEEYFDDVAHYLMTGFFADEPLSKCLGAIHDEPTCTEMGAAWIEALKLKMSLICLTKDQNGKPKIAGFNVLYPSKKNDKTPMFQSQISTKIFAVLSYFEKQKNPFEEFGCDAYLSAMGLYVLPEFRGEGLGQEILAAREAIGKCLGFKISLTVFTTPASQKPAERVGFQEYVTLNYSDLAKINSLMDIPGLEKYTKFGKYMYMKYK